MNRNSAIDFLKFLFAAIIVVFHGGCALWTGERGEYPMSGGAIGVEFFFIVSGYLMVASEARRAKTRTDLVDDTCSFIGSKIRSLLPGYFIAWFIAFIFINISEDGVTPVELVKRLSSSIFELAMVNMSGLNPYRVNHAVWYISAMLIGMVVLYPLLAMKRRLFLKILAPFAAIMIFGYMYQKYTCGFGGPSEFGGLLLKGLERGIAGMCTGAACWNAVEKIKQTAFTKLGTGLLTLIELGCYGYVLMYAFFMEHSVGDYVCVVFLAAGLTITFSSKSWLAAENSRVCRWLGEWSLYLFLNNRYWASVVHNWYPDVPYERTMPYYLALVAVSSLAVMFLSRFLRKRSGKIFALIKGRIQA